MVVARVWQKAYQVSLGMVRGKEEKRRPEKIREKNFPGKTLLTFRPSINHTSHHPWFQLYSLIYGDHYLLS